MHVSLDCRAMQFIQSNAYGAVNQLQNLQNKVSPQICRKCVSGIRRWLLAPCRLQIQHCSAVL